MSVHAVAASSDAPGVQSGEGGSQPTLLLHIPEDFSQDRYDIRLISRETATLWCERWHYTGDIPQVSQPWGVFAPDLGAVVCLSPPSNLYGVATRLGLSDIPGNIEVSRVAVHPDMPSHTSRLLWLVLRRAQRAAGWSWVFSYADTGQGHHGGIYQALGAVYVGLTGSTHVWVHKSGEVLHPRSAVELFGSQATVAMAERGYLKAPGGTPKHTYVIPVGPRAAEVRARLAPLSLPYPKRAS